MLSTYATKEKFFKEVYKNTGNKMYKNPSKIESNNRYFQVKNFVWELKTGDILLAFKAADIRGEPAKLIGIGILGNEKEQNYQYDVTIHIKDVKWHELKNTIEIRKYPFLHKFFRGPRNNNTIYPLDEIQDKLKDLLIKTNPEISVLIGIGKPAEPEKVSSSELEKDLAEAEKEIKTAMGKETNIEKEILEGKNEYKEILFRIRNREIVESKKSKSNYSCEVCGFNFEEKYGDIGSNYITVHHLKPMKEREKPSKTTESDLALVCDNCHRMLHRKDPPLGIEELNIFLK